MSEPEDQGEPTMEEILASIRRIISEEERLRLLEGEGRGRGLYITHRIIRLINGKLEIKVGKNTTTIVVRLPIHE